MAKKACDSSPNGQHEPVNATIIQDGKHILVSVCNWCGKRM